LGTTDDDTEGLGDRIARLRRAKGWNQKDLGGRLGMRAAQVSKCERGSHSPRADLLRRLSEVLGVSSDYLLTGRSFGEPQRDFRLRERLEALEQLPEPQRNHLVEFLDALLSAHQLLRQYEQQREQKKAEVKPPKPGARSRRPARMRD
jgi:transcriptional regulator with XRE-family HTH domain